MRCRPPLPSMLESSLYDTQYAAKFSHKFGGSNIATSAQQKSLPILLDEMKACNIVKAVYEVCSPTAYDTNAEAQTFLQQYGQHFVAMVGTDITNIPASCDNIEYYRHVNGFVGVNLDPGSPALNEKSIFLDNETLFPIFQLCQDHDLPITIAFGGYAYPDATAYLPIRIENIIRTFPKLRLCFCHGVWPYTAQACGLALQYSNIYLSPDSYLMEMPSAQDYVLGANYLIPEQILFGTSYPFHAQNRVYNYYLNVGFSSAILSKVLYTNATHFLKLDTTSQYDS